MTSVFHELSLNRFGVTLRMRSSEEYRETLQGVLLSATSTNSDPGVSASTVLKIQAGKATLTTRTGDTTHIADMPWDPQVIGPEAANRKVRETGFAPGKETTFTTYDAELQRITHCSVTIQGREVVTIEGKPRDLHKGEMVQDIVPGVATQVWLDENGDTLKSVTPLLGGVETLRVSREDALRAAAAPGSLPDLEKQLQITSDTVIERPGAVTEALYRIEGPIEKLNLEDRRQKIEDHGPGWVLLRVKALADAPERSSEKPGPEYLAPSPYLQCDDPDIVRAAREAAGAETRPADKARALTAWVYRRIVKKDYAVGFASAKEALLSREGDCTEHAVLLAALLRAAGDPLPRRRRRDLLEGRVRLPHVDRGVPQRLDRPGRHAEDGSGGRRAHQADRKPPGDRLSRGAAPGARAGHGEPEDQGAGGQGAGLAGTVTGRRPGIERGRIRRRRSFRRAIRPHRCVELANVPSRRSGR